MSSFSVTTITTAEVVEGSEESSDFEPDDVYIVHVDDPMSSFSVTTTTTEVAEEFEESSDSEPDDVYIVHVDDPMSSSGDEFDHDEP